MRNIKRIKRWKTRLGVAILSAAALGVATEQSVEAANGNGGKTSLLAAAGRPETSASSENGNGGFWPRLGSNAGSAVNVDGNALSSGASNGGAAGAQNRVESANFVGYSGSSDENEPGGATNGRTRLVDWTTSDALPVQSFDASPSTAPVGEIGEVAKASADKENAASAPVGEIGEAAKTSANRGNAASAEIEETAKASADKENAGTAAIASSGESESRSKTPILRDEPTAATRGGGSFGGALVSTFGALAVVLGAFLPWR